MPTLAGMKINDYFVNFKIEEGWNFHFDWKMKKLIGHYRCHIVLLSVEIINLQLIRKLIILVSQAINNEWDAWLVAIRGHPLSTYAKYSEKLAFLTPWYAHVRVRIRELEIIVFRKSLPTYLMMAHKERKRQFIYKHLCFLWSYWRYVLINHGNYKANYFIPTHR